MVGRAASTVIKRSQARKKTSMRILPTPSWKPKQQQVLYSAKMYMYRATEKLKWVRAVKSKKLMRLLISRLNLCVSVISPFYFILLGYLPFTSYSLDISLLLHTPWISPFYFILLEYYWSIKRSFFIFNCKFMQQRKRRKMLKLW